MENIEKFYEALAKDEAMQERAKGLGGISVEHKEDALKMLVEFADEEGYSFTLNEAKMFIKEKNNGEPDEKALGAIADGYWCVLLGNTNPQTGECSCFIAGSGEGCGCLVYGAS